jgi:hypothetical protein
VRLRTPLANASKAVKLAWAMGVFLLFDEGDRNIASVVISHRSGPDNFSLNHGFGKGGNGGFAIGPIAIFGVFPKDEFSLDEVVPLEEVFLPGFERDVVSGNGAVRVVVQSDPHLGGIDLPDVLARALDEGIIGLSEGSLAK